MNRQDGRRLLESGAGILGIELGSTRIKAVLIGPDHTLLAQGDHTWENRLEHGIWTYSLESVWSGLQDAYEKLAADAQAKYAVRPEKLAAIGVSAMMHGYLAFDQDDRLLTPFRTWRNTITGQAAEALTQAFAFNVPQRWSVAHLYQAMLNGEAHVPQISYLTTLAGYVHWRLTGKKVLGIGDASGMFPIDSGTRSYSEAMLRSFDGLAAEHSVPWTLGKLLPTVLPAGEPAGVLTEEGARLLDPAGSLKPGIPLCPPEGDAGTGMTATNSVAPRTGNVSAGTSVFAMVVLEKPLAKHYPEIDMVTTPTGRAAAMVHCNNCTSDLNAWVRLFREASGLLGGTDDLDEIYGALYRSALEGDADCGGLLAYNYYSGEPVTKLKEGRPLFLRTPDANFTLANFMRAHLFSAAATLRLGMDLLTKTEGVAVDALTGHGGLFKTEGVAQRLMAGALQVPISCMETAGEGGPWGMALLASYLVQKAPGQTLEDFLAETVFAGEQRVRVCPDAADAAGFEAYLRRFRAGLPAERAAVETLI